MNVFNGNILVIHSTRKVLIGNLPKQLIFDTDAWRMRKQHVERFFPIAMIKLFCLENELVLDFASLKLE